MADNSTIIRIFNEFFEDKSGEEIEQEEEELKDDNDKDPDYVPHEHNFIIKEEINEVIENIENLSIPPTESRKKKKNLSSETDNIFTSKKINNGVQIRYELCAVN